MGKLKIVEFTAKGVKIHTNPPNAEALMMQSNTIVNPNLEKVLGVAPHLWDLRNGEIVPLEGARKAPTRPRKKLRHYLLPLVYALAGAALAQAISAYL
jgi:hypothetical protein